MLIPKKVVEYCNVNNSLELIKFTFLKPDKIPFAHIEDAFEPVPTKIDPMAENMAVEIVQAPIPNTESVRVNSTGSSSKGTK